MNSDQKRVLLHIGLFAITVLSTTAAGAEWMTAKALLYAPEEQTLSWAEFWQGLHYSIPFLGILTVHEFGHYFVARHYKLNVTLPFYIPLWLGFLGHSINIGTMGAFIKIRTQISSRKEFFDVGIAGPLAGLVVALGVLYYGFTHLPPPEYIFQIHPEYQPYGLDYANHVYEKTKGGNMALGTNLVFEFFKTYVVENPALLPNDYEIMHYPYLLAGYLSLFFTALNLMPIGQLDGGHIIYGLLGAKGHRWVAFCLFFGFITYAGLGILTPQDDIWHLLTYAPLYFLFLYFVFSKTFKSPWNVASAALGVFTVQFLISHFFPNLNGYYGWLLFATILGRTLGISHPTTPDERPLDWKRQVLGWLTLIIFILCFTPMPLRVL